VTWDETYTSQRAEKGKKKKYKKEQSDSEAARLLLQEYLDSPEFASIKAS
jgi:RNase H-fold protein (predicted Holliday junction resolvase)